MEFSFTVFLNWPFINKITKANSFFEFLDYIMTVFITFLLISLPIFIVVFYRKYFHKLGQTKFQDRWGSVYEGMKHTNKSILAYYVIFMVRRMILAATILYIPDFIWLQIFMTIYLTQFAAIYLVHYKPFEDPLVQRLEVFNEITTILLLHVIYCFTPLLPEK